MSTLVSHPNDVIELDIPNEVLRHATLNAHKGSMNQYSQLGGERNVDGLLAELMVHRYLPKMLHQPTSFYDLITPPGYRPLTIDVKNKFDVKRQGGKPDLDWDCTIYGYEAGKACDLYLFTSTNSTNTKIWLKGFIDKKGLVNEQNLYRAGSTRRTTQGSVTYRKDNYVLQVKQLGTMAYLKSSIAVILS